MSRAGRMIRPSLSTNKAVKERQILFMRKIVVAEMSYLVDIQCFHCACTGGNSSSLKVYIQMEPISPTCFSKSFRALMAALRIFTL